MVPGMGGTRWAPPTTPLPSPSGGHCHFSSARMDLAGTRKASALAWNRGSLGGQEGDACACGLGTGRGSPPGLRLYLMPTVVWMRVVMPTQVKMVPMR